MNALPRCLLIVTAEVDEAVEADWSKWYDEVHLPDALACPGVLAGRRYVTAGDISESVRGERRASPRKIYTTVYELAGADVESLGDRRSLCVSSRADRDQQQLVGAGLPMKWEALQGRKQKELHRGIVEHADAAINERGRFSASDVEFLHASLPAAAPTGDRLPSLAEAERAHIIRVLEAVQWNKKEASRVLSISRGTLYRKIVEYSLEPEPRNGAARRARPAGRSS